MSAINYFNAGIAALFIILSGHAEDASEKDLKAEKAGQEKPQQNVEITFDQAKASPEKLVFKGNVTIVDAAYSLKADHVEAILTKDPKTQQTSYEKLTATGDPAVLISENGTLRAKTISYNCVTGIALTTGDPVLELTDGATMTGADTIMMNRDHKKLWTVGGTPRISIPNNGNRNNSLTSILGDTDSSETKAPEAKEKEEKTDEAVAANSVPLPPTVITAKTIKYDMGNGKIDFVGDVHVIDEQLDIQSDSLQVLQDAEGNPTSILANALPGGVVTITHEKGLATGPSANYDLVKGLLTIAGKATLKQPDGIVYKDAERVEFNRKTKTFEAVKGKVTLPAGMVPNVKLLPEIGKKNDKKTAPARQLK